MKIPALLKFALIITIVFVPTKTISQIETSNDSISTNTKVFDVFSFLKDSLNFNNVAVSPLDSLGTRKVFLKKIFPKHDDYKIAETIFIPLDSLELASRNSSNSATSLENGYGNRGIGGDIIEVESLKPTLGSFSFNTSDVTDDLNSGKVNITVPLFDFEYYDYKIPVFINNRYPQKITQPFGEPTFYTNSRIGGSWTLSIDQYKVSRQVNGIKDEDPYKGYFTTTSFPLTQNPSQLTQPVVLAGINGAWDSELDIYSFSTPTVSGSFLLNLLNGSARNLTDANFKVSYTYNNENLTSFTITDEKGTQYLFGGDTSTLEVSESRTSRFSIGYDLAQENGGLGYRMQYICKAHEEAINTAPPNYYPIFTTVYVVDDSAVPSAYSNLFTYNSLWHDSPMTAPCYASVNSILNQIHDYGFFDSCARENMVNLGDGLYGIRDLSSNLIGGLASSYDDPNLRRNPTVTGWYLKEIKLLNEKKITFNYENSSEAFETFGINKLNIMSDNAAGIPLHSIWTYPCQGVKYFKGLPAEFEPRQFPLNETFSRTLHYQLSPKLVSIQDQDLITKISINPPGSPTRAQRPYLCSPFQYLASDNVPQYVLYDTTNGTVTADLNPTLISRINYTKNNKTFEVDFGNHSQIRTFVDPNDGITKRVPWLDRSSLDQVVINKEKKYSFSFANGAYEVTYPTGMIKKFRSDGLAYGYEEQSNDVHNYFNQHYQLLNGNVYDIDYYVSKIETIVDQNSTLEEYDHDVVRSFTGSYYTHKKFQSIGDAVVVSSAPLFNSHATKSGFAFPIVNKKINGKLRTKSELMQPNLYPINNTLQTPIVPFIFDPSFKRPETYFDEMSNLVKKVTEYKTINGQEYEERITEYNRDFTSPTLDLPSLYLTNAEAGPYAEISGGLFPAYSTYYYPSGLEQSKITKKETLFLDQHVQVATEEESSFVRYKNSGLNVRKVTNSKNTDSKGNVWINVFRSYELFGTANNNTLLQNMKSHNICPDFEILKYKNDQLIGAEAYKYKLQATPTSQIPVLESVKSLETIEAIITNFSQQHQSGTDPNTLVFDSRLKDKIIYDIYDSDGRLLQYHTVNGMYTTIVWGYKNQFPIAKIENAILTEVGPRMVAYNLVSASNLDFDNCRTSTCKEELLRGALNALRTDFIYKDKWRVSTYTYDYDCGLTSATDVRGNTTYYEYDKLLRLKLIRDTQGNIIKTYDYHYKQ